MTFNLTEAQLRSMYDEAVVEGFYIAREHSKPYVTEQQIDRAFNTYMTYLKAKLKIPTVNY